ncbi:hypothetical protein R69888_05579 [Paraburkholderia haematera]|jgi:hypothetical protein|uniref:Uncharacterized protein n=1 Tax=Paraburkholderia haematera TaxID=2793077 RepID=A0ABM8SH07_9BURK|nr:hypothetical protein R69888_05579 [Paraburkholderia haematera]
MKSNKVNTTPVIFITLFVTSVASAQQSDSRSDILKQVQRSTQATEGHKDNDDQSNHVRHPKTADDINNPKLSKETLSLYHGH